MTEPINASKNVCTCHKPTKKGIPAKLNQHIVGFYTAILFLWDESLIGKVVKINPYLCNLSLRTLNIFHFRPNNALNMSVHRLLNRCSGLVASEKIRHAASKVSNMLTAHICIIGRRWVGSRSVIDEHRASSEHEPVCTQARHFALNRFNGVERRFLSVFTRQFYFLGTKVS